MKIQSPLLHVRRQSYGILTGLLAVFALVFCNSTPVHAKRMPPPPAQSLEYKGIRYVAPNDNGEVAYLQVWDASQNRLLYTVNVFRNPINPNLEQDVQHVYISNLSVANNFLVVSDERGRSHYYDIESDGKITSDNIQNNNNQYNKGFKNKDKKKKPGGKKKGDGKKSGGKKKGGKK
jgi:hypothetical protein